MFSFDEELFNSASDKIISAQEQLDDLKNTIDSINNSTVECDFWSDINAITSSIQAINSSIKELNFSIKRTKYFADASKELFVVFKGSLGRLYPHDSWTDVLEWMIEKDTSPFSFTPGQYGGAQQNPLDLYEKYIINPEQLNDVEKTKVENIIDMFKKRGITDQNQIDYLLMFARTSGCGYVVVANTICDAYRDNPDAFERKYGYSLYYMQDGERYYNYESIVVDTFLSSNDSKLKGIVDNENDVNRLFMAFGVPIEDTSIWVDEMPNIINATDSSITGKVVKRDISVDTYKKNMENGDYDYACIAVRRFTLKPFANNDSTENYYSDGGHWMNITGISSNNNFIVSSWGKEWELISGTPYTKGREWIFIQPEHENDGGLVFFKVGDISGE